MKTTRETTRTLRINGTDVVADKKYSVAKSANIVGLSKFTIYKAMREGKLKANVRGRNNQYCITGVELWKWSEGTII